MLENYRDFKNRFDFFIREKINLSRKNYGENGTTHAEILGLVPPSSQRQIEKLIYRSGLSKYFPLLSAKTILDNLRHFEILDYSQYKPITKNKKSRNQTNAINLLDIGSKRFSYCFVLKEYFGDQLKSLTAVEIDGNRLYRNFYSNKECAKYYLRSLSAHGENNNCTVNYIHQDITNYWPNNSPELFEVITIFDPFVSKFALQNWGLPLNLLNQRAFFAKVCSLLVPTGTLIVTNLDQNEAFICKNLMESQFLIKQQKILFSDISRREFFLIVAAKR